MCKWILNRSKEFKIIGTSLIDVQCSLTTYINYCMEEWGNLISPLKQSSLFYSKVLVLDYKQILISSVRSFNTLYHLFIQENSGSVYTILHILNPLAYHMFIIKSEQQNISVAESFYNLSLNFTAF